MIKEEGLKLENQLCFPLYVASKEVIRKYRPYLEALDLTYTQYIAMMVLWEEKEINVKDLGSRLYLDSGTLTPLLKSLESKGYIKRYRQDEDERVVMTELTRKGERLKEKAALVPEKMAACLKLQNKEALELYRLLNKVINSL
ncbi:MAG: MarR family transcriptional regulator [Erysipelotrichaceae bacterium]|nr:MarR family transcriptional regulator [Erysipelotrichaceae bacterium]MBR0462721.1 MarR family transcriptional regulator [Erysipelotrichaceae bacterium]